MTTFSIKLAQIVADEVGRFRIIKDKTQDDASSLLRARTALAYASMYGRMQEVDIPGDYKMIVPKVLPETLMHDFLIGRAVGPASTYDTAPEENKKNMRVLAASGWGRYILEECLHTQFVKGTFNMEDHGYGYIAYNTDSFNPLNQQPLVAMIPKGMQLEAILRTQFNLSLKWLTNNPQHIPLLESMWKE